MSAMPDDDEPVDEWVDEWNADDWHELSLIDRDHRNADSWGAWVLRLLALALAVPVILGVLVWLLILAF